ncbi:MAG TPA: MmcQ/YjbR family DNA-binding protein [Vicinamibacteria bacterium]
MKRQSTVNSRQSTVSPRGRAITFKTVLKVGLALEGTEEGTSYGTPALKVKGKLYARLREDGRTLAVRTSFLDRDALLQLDPGTFFLTDHYRDYPWVLVRLTTVGSKRLREVLEQAWRLSAPRPQRARRKP